MSLPRRFVPRLVRRYLGRLRFPTLFLLTAALFAVNVVVADPIPFVDEILLALFGLLLASLRERRRGREDSPPGDPPVEGSDPDGRANLPGRDHGDPSDPA